MYFAYSNGLPITILPPLGGGRTSKNMSVHYSKVRAPFFTFLFFSPYFESTFFFWIGTPKNRINSKKNPTQISPPTEGGHAYTQLPIAKPPFFKGGSTTQNTTQHHIPPLFLPFPHLLLLLLFLTKWNQTGCLWKTLRGSALLVVALLCRS